MYKPEYETSSLTSKARSNFVSKVFSIVGVQLLVTTAVVGINMNYPKFARFQLESTLLFWVSIIGAIGSMLALSKFFMLWSIVTVPIENLPQQHGLAGIVHSLRKSLGFNHYFILYPWNCVLVRIGNCSSHFRFGIVCHDHKVRFHFYRKQCYR